MEINNPIKQVGNMDYNVIIKPYLEKWKWFVFSAAFALIIGILYIRYTTPEYQVQAKIQILQEKDAIKDLSAFTDLESINIGSKKIEDEIEIFSSRSNLVEVTKSLGLNIRILSLGRLYDTDLYINAPFKVNFVSPDSTINKAKVSFTIDILDDNSFTLTHSDLPPRKYDFGNAVETEFVDFILIPDVKNIGALEGREFKIVINPVGDVAQGLKNRLEVSTALEYSNILRIGLKDPIPQRAKDIINELINLYNQKAVDDKKAIADRTFSFINERIEDIYTDLSSSEQLEEDFKESSGIAADVASQANINLNVGAANRQQLQNARVDLNIAQSIESEIDNMVGYQLLPSNIGDASISSAVSQYNQIVLERNDLLRSSGERNPTVVNLNAQLQGLKNSLKSSLERMISNLSLEVNNLSSQLSQINYRIYSAPGQERALRDISRRKETAEGLYLYVMQKREESQITFASATPKSNVIDYAYLTSPVPVSPRKPIVLLACLMIGGIIPFSIIYLVQLLDNNVHNKIGLEAIVGRIPVLAELPKLGKKEKTLVKTADRSVLAESMRILRTNLDYMIKTGPSKSGGHMVFVSSSVPGEGKTFVASNLAMIYAKANKNVLLIGGDIRNPKIDKFYSGRNVDELKRVSGNKDNKGLTDYLIDETLTARDITRTMLVTDQTVDIIHSGKLMPNPAELLMNQRLESLVEEVREHYDYIIVDTAPMVVVSDTLLMTKFADIVLYVTRANVTNIKVLEFPLRLYEEQKFKRLAFLVNGVKENNLGYGGKYGYGYGKTTRKWWSWN
jgi:capsular exopolysaccharide synthesis family protein